MRLHRFAVVTAAATYVLLLVGGLVHATGSSLACPDWPLCHGQVFPAMEHGVEYEHTHRLVAGTVAVMTCVLSVLLFLDARYKALRPLALAAPLMVVAQAVLGGLTVLFKLPKLITLSHLTLSMCFFAVTLVLALRTREIDAERTVETPAVGSPTFDPKALTFVGVVAVLGQILLGGFVRHTMSGLACITFPLCYGEIWPPESTSSGSERIHMLHRFGGMIVALLVVAIAVTVIARARRLHAEGAPQARALFRLAVAAPVLVALQITLGVLNVTSLLSLVIMEAHLAVGAALLGTLVATWTLLPSARTTSRAAPEVTA